MDNKQWYSNKEVLFECVKQLNHRECALKVIPQQEGEKSPMIRFGKCFTIAYFESFAKRWGFFDRPMNLYKSLASYNHQPVMSFNPKLRPAQREEWLKVCHNHMVALDIGMDFDAKDIQEAYLDCKKVKAMLDDYEVGYICKFSGSKGFHLRIPYEYLPHMDSVEEQSILHKEVLETLHYEHDIKTLDLSVFDTMRVFKLAWSIDQKGGGLIALPLTDEMFENFSTSMCLPENVLKDVNIRDTHLFERRTDLSAETKVLNTCEWIENL